MGNFYFKMSEGGRGSDATKMQITVKRPRTPPLLRLLLNIWFIMRLGKEKKKRTSEEVLQKHGFCSSSTTEELRDPGPGSLPLSCVLRVKWGIWWNGFCTAFLLRYLYQGTEMTRVFTESVVGTERFSSRKPEGFQGLVNRGGFCFVCLSLPDSLYSCQSSSINITKVSGFMLR